ncbi:MaoC/PaaZ C-terminal domain-containing protein [Allohahella marinimesophila]|uniref:MaoC/PaaZ C-terminal domain-containing protein n=1 Tax=Allohahella marinimesophila TaxID=1054972 RepID=A0ABP7P1T2_9GAMM
MNTVDLESLGRYARVLGTIRKKPGKVQTLPSASYVDREVTIDGDHLTRYADLCGFSADQGVPLTYPQLLTFPLALEYMASEASPWSGLGTVHLASDIRQRRALHAGDTVTVELRTGELLAHRKGQVFTLESRILRGTEEVWSSTQSLLRIGVAEPQGKPYTHLNAPDDPLAMLSTFKAPGNTGRRYGLVSGDLNPIHLSAVSAKLFGFKRAIAHGMWTKARALAELLPSGPTDEVRASVEFKSPLFLPAKAALWATRDDRSSRFEVRADGSQVTHLRGLLTIQETTRS